ncbi:MAG: hypothetical protein A2270_10460 [Elusimicrobia bacterium RIFOXYA12_FULL_51_18]|nr:MAG: hypothetical protein A2270_10460 [Elusimicrobia bacterium RIFOXYA12_FULL_51_18]OGS29514.1 MAG: hypothetical protein A2218_00730 [Elusimicrobia bacterium RIFOXYA2_FULL_53_38]
MTLLTKIFGFIIRRPQEAAIILLALMLAVMYWQLRHETGRAEQLTAKIEGLPPDTKQTVTIYREHVVTKWRDGPTKIEYRDRYLPPEGHVEVVSKVDQPEKPPEVVVKDRGFTRRLGGGIVYSRKLLALVDFKWAYLGRYSLTAGITPQFGGIGISRHVDDFTPFQNLEVQCIAGLGWGAKFSFGIGLRTNF